MKQDGKTISKSEEEILLNKIRTILLQKDRDELQRITQILENEEQLAQKVSPILEKRIGTIKENFPEEFGKSINPIIAKKIKDSQQELIDILSPVLGRMIKKFISHQFQMLKESIDAQIKQTFSTGIIGRVKAAIFGVEHSDLVLSELDKYEVEEAYVIQHHSGLLLGSYSQSKMRDRDMIAGMFTAIKAFAEDAFARNKEKEALEMIEYGNYKIYTQAFSKYYIALAITGSLSTRDKDILFEKLFDLSDEMPKDLSIIDTELNNKVSIKLAEYFQPS